MARTINLIDKVVGKLQVVSMVPKNERPTQTHGNYWLCKCACGNYVKVPTTYLTGNSNYTQTSCGCDRKKYAFLASSGFKDATIEYLDQFQDFEKFLFIHKALIRTSGQDGSYYNEHFNEYKTIIEYFYSDTQFNILYSFWLKNNKQDNTFYDWAKPSLDHIIPKSRGGSNSIENLQFLTVFENLAKRDMTWEEWCHFKQMTHTTSDYYLDQILLQKGDQE